MIAIAAGRSPLYSDGGGDGPVRGGYLPQNLALRTDGSVVAWGAYYGGTVPGLSNVVAIAAGYLSGLALRSDGTVVGWGATTVPKGLSNVVALSASGSDEVYPYADHSLALLANGTVVAWGRGAQGQTNVPIGLSNCVAIAAGSLHSLALLRLARSPLATVHIVPQFLIRATESNHLFILAPNNVSAMVVLDGSQSSDPDNDPLGFFWYADGQSDLLASGIFATNQFAVGPHTVTLIVSDGQLAATNEVSFEVITPAVAVAQLRLLVDESLLSTRIKQPLLASLLAGAASFDRGNMTAGLNQLTAFKHKVRAQVEPLNAPLANRFIAAAEQIVTVISGD